MKVTTADKPKGVPFPADEVRGKPVWQFMVDHPTQGWIRVGRPSLDKAALVSWRSFVKKFWRGLPIRTVQVASMLSSAPGGDRGT